MAVADGPRRAGLDPGHPGPAARAGCWTASPRPPVSSPTSASEIEALIGGLGDLATERQRAGGRPRGAPARGPGPALPGRPAPPGPTSRRWPSSSQALAANSQRPDRRPRPGAGRAGPAHQPHADSPPRSCAPCSTPSASSCSRRASRPRGCSAHEPLRPPRGLRCWSVALAVGSGCSLRTAGSPQGDLELTAEFDDVANLVVGHSVQLADVDRGHGDRHRPRRRPSARVTDVDRGRRRAAGGHQRRPVEDLAAGRAVRRAAPAGPLGRRRSTSAMLAVRRRDRRDPDHRRLRDRDRAGHRVPRAR